MFHHVIEHWMCNEKVACINCFDNLNDLDAMNECAKSFSRGSRNAGVLGGIIGVLDGWLVKIKCPSKNRDLISNLGSVFCRK